MTPGIAERCGMLGGSGGTKLAMRFIDRLQCITITHDERKLLVRL